TGVISGHVDKHIRFWDTRSGECTNELSGVHTGQITSLDMAEDRNTLLTQSRDNTLKLIDLRMSQVVATMWYVERWSYDLWTNIAHFAYRLVVKRTTTLIESNYFDYVLGVRPM
ncbi:hypothetical protein SARC_13297, partial [Sphaeroforma arctica JP610]